MRVIPESLRHLCLATGRESVARGDNRRAEYHHTSFCQNLDSQAEVNFEPLLQDSFFFESPLCQAWSVARRNGCGF